MPSIEMPSQLTEKDIKLRLSSIIEITQEQDPVEGEKKLGRDISDRSSEEQAGIVEAMNLAREIHWGQTRLTGVDYINHSIHVARIHLKIDPHAEPDSIKMGLLHDGLENTDDYLKTARDIRTRTGERVLFGVDALSRVKIVNGEPTKIKDSDYYGLMLQADREDPQLGIVTAKGADRGGNLFDPPFISTLSEDNREKLRMKREKTILNTQEFLIPLLLSERPGLQSLLKTVNYISTNSFDFKPDNWKDKLEPLLNSYFAQKSA